MKSSQSTQGLIDLDLTIYTVILREYLVTPAIFTHTTLPREIRSLSHHFEQLYIYIRFTSLFLLLIQYIPLPDSLYFYIHLVGKAQLYILTNPHSLDPHMW